MDLKLVLRQPPPLDPAWLEYEQDAGLLTKSPPPDIHAHKLAYKNACRKRNESLLSGRDAHLSSGITSTGFEIRVSRRGIKCRKYTPVSIPSASGQDPGRVGKTPTVIYYHGGGLYVGDLSCEDLTCRRMCKELQCDVYSVDYRLMPKFTPDDALADALDAFRHLVRCKEGPFILAGSSSGGQLAAQVSQAYVKSLEPGDSGDLKGVLLRAPVTCDASEGGENVPSRFKQFHTSMSKAFETSILAGTCVDAAHRTTAPLPLEEEDLTTLPRHWIQVCTNDVYLSDGVCYVEALREAGVKVKLDVIEGWPHTFWLEAPMLERSVEAEGDMIEGLRWLMSDEMTDVFAPVNSTE